MPRYYGHEKVVFQLAHSFDPRDPFSVKPDMGLFSINNSSLPAGDNNRESANLYYDFRQVTRQEQYYEALSLDTTLAAKWSLASGRASLSVAKELEINERSLSLVFAGVKDFNQEILGGTVELSEKGKIFLKRAVQTNRIADFIRLTGTEIVTSVKKSSRIFVIYHVLSSSAQKKEDLAAKLRFNWSAGNVKVNIENVVKEIDNNAVLTIKAFQLGTNTSSISLTDLIKSKQGDLEGIKSIIADSLKNAVYANATIIEATTQYLSSVIPEIIFPEDSASDAVRAAYEQMIQLTPLIDAEILKLAEKQEKILKEIGKINSLSNSEVSPSIMKEDSQKKLQAYQESITVLSNQVKSLHLQLMGVVDNTAFNTIKNEAAKIQVNESKLEDYVFLPLIKGAGWISTDVRVDRRGDSEFYDFYHYYYLIFAINNVSLITRVEIYNGKNVLQKVLEPQDLESIIRKQGIVKDFWKLELFFLNRYGWGWECHHCPGIIKELLETHKNFVKDEEYYIRIFTKDNFYHTLKLGNPIKPLITAEKNFIDGNVQTLIA